MNLNLAELQRKLLAAARREAPRAQVPYAFEKRVMARLMARPEPAFQTGWVRALWSAAAVCSLVTLLTGAWSLHDRAGRRSADPALEMSFAKDLEQTILDSADEGDVTW